MTVDINLIKKYLRIDDGYTEEDDIIQLLINNALTYLENAGVVIDETNTNQVELAKLIIAILVSDWYENRELTTSNTSEKIRDIVSSMIMQLKYCY